MVDLATKLKSKLQEEKIGRVVVENTGNIGKSYRRHDEIGTPLCVTIDFKTLEEGTVTVRDRDTMDQFRISSEEIPGYFRKYLK